MGAEVIIFGQSLNSQFLKGLTHSALMMVTLTTPSFACESVTSTCTNRLLQMWPEKTKKYVEPGDLLGNDPRNSLLTLHYGLSP